MIAIPLDQLSQSFHHGDLPQLQSDGLAALTDPDIGSEVIGLRKRQAKEYVILQVISVCFPFKSLYF